MSDRSIIIVFAVGISIPDSIIDNFTARLAAIEENGDSKTVAKPKLLTADKKEATVKTGTEIPYSTIGDDGQTEVEFKEAALSLQATPQITPDDRIIMDLKINQDSIGDVFNGIPSINTNALETQVLVENGETIVLGGIFRSTETNATTKTPFFGDLPLIGVLFRRTEHTETKAELLVFITPRLVKDTLSTR